MTTIATYITRNAAALGAAIILTVGAASASAQNRTLVGNIPFSFDTAHAANLPAGTYEIKPTSIMSAANTLVFYNKTTHKTVMVPVSSGIAGSTGQAPRVEFACSQDECRLTRVYYGGDGWQILQRNRTPAETERLIRIKLMPEEKR